MATLQDFDIVLLDLMLPGLDGKSFCKKYRSMRNTPIIVISAKSQLEDKLELFDLGADDYLTKPFELEELAARIRALLKRGVIGNIFHYQDISVDLHKKEASKKGKLQHLTLKEFQILELLIKNKGVTISRTDIITELRGDDAIWEADNKLDVYISNLRKKLDKKLITTIKGYGYTIGGD